MTLAEFVTKYLGKQVEYHSYNPNAKYQCVDLVNQYIVDVLGKTPIIGTDAKDFPSKYNKEQFDWIPNTPEAIIKAGDIPVWSGNVGDGAGHIAIALKDGTLTQFESLDQNLSRPLFVTKEIHNYNNVLGWLHPKGTTMPDDMMQISKADFERLVTKSTAYDKIIADGYVTKVEHDKEVADLNERLNLAEEDYDKLAVENAQLKKQLAEQPAQPTQPTQFTKTITIAGRELVMSGGANVTIGNTSVNYKAK